MSIRTKKIENILKKLENKKENEIKRLNILNEMENQEQSDICKNKLEKINKRVSKMIKILHSDRVISIKVNLIEGNGISIVGDFTTSSTSSLMRMEKAFTIIEGEIYLDTLFLEILKTRYFIKPEFIISLINKANKDSFFSLTSNNLLMDDFNMKHSKYWTYDSWIVNQRNVLHRELNTPYTREVSDGRGGFDLILFGLNEKNQFESFNKGKKITSSLVELIKDKYNFKDWLIDHRVNIGEFVSVDNKTNALNSYRGFSNINEVVNCDNSRVLRVS